MSLFKFNTIKIFLNKKLLYNNKPKFFTNNSNIDKIKLCKNCKYYIPIKQYCSKFSKINLVTGKTIYDDAYYSRYMLDKCCEYAKYYEKNYFKIFTFPFYFIKYNLFYFSLFCYCGFISYIFFY